MKIALPVWQDRISPVFDVAGQVLVVDVTSGRETARDVRALADMTPEGRVTQLAEWGVDRLVCAAISQPLEVALADRGVRVFARVCGGVEEVLAAFLAGCLGEERFAMPGCYGQRRRHMARRGCQRGRGRGRKENL